jgi:hypothetical protein
VDEDGIGHGDAEGTELKRGRGRRQDGEIEEGFLTSRTPFGMTGFF